MALASAVVNFMISSQRKLLLSSRDPSTLGWGVLASAGAVALIQGSLTAVGYFAGDVLSTAQVDALTATGGVVLLALGLRLLDLKQIPVGDLLPALLLAPPLVSLTAALF